MRSKIIFTGWYIRFFFVNLAIILSKFLGGVLGLALFALHYPRAVWKFKNKGL